MGGEEKLIWILVLFGFLSLELTSIKTERNAHEAEQKAARLEQLQHFGEIGKGIQTSVEESQLQFQATMGRSNEVYGGVRETLQSMTGGRSFCYLDIRPDSPTDIVAMLMDKGRYPVTEAQIRIVDEDAFASFLEQQRQHPSLELSDDRTSEKLFYRNFIRTGSFAETLSHYAFKSDARSFNAEIIARNGLFQELVRVTHSNVGFATAKIVIVSYYDGVRGVALEKIDAGFPKETLVKDKEWQSFSRLPRLRDLRP
jgi:hypothetical protein